MDAPVTTRFFSLREANALLPTLREEFTRARALRDSLLGVHEKLQETGHGIEGPDVAVDASAPQAVRRLQARAARIIGRLREIIRAVSELGIEIKAADGLVDFRSKLHGRTVYLCWKFGEDRVTHFHELDAGFAGRRPIPDDGDFTGDLLH
ncbi:MAG TPA: DUF2203 domain-containing protein, partial [Myxococcales bacterium]|nr:DUF2203 domain-containing protein [Myxococcales bacterium]